MKHARSAVVISSCVLCTWVAACGLSSAGTGSATVDDVADGSNVQGPGTDSGNSTIDGNFSVDSSQPFNGGDTGASLDTGIVDATPPDPYLTRVTTNLVALYEFEEDTGTSVGDKIAPAYNLQIEEAGDVSWQPHYLSITNYTTLTNTATFDKFTNAIGTSNAFTVEAWVKFTGVDNSGGSGTYGRLVSVADSDGNRAVDLGDILGGGSSSGSDGYMGVIGNDDDVQKGNVASSLVHLVLVANNTDLTLFVNGANIGGITDSDTPKDDDSKEELYVANVKNGDRGVKGDLHLIAFYSAALTPTQIATNYAAGPDPGLPHDN